MLKRLVDVVVALSAILIFSPIILLLMLITAMVSKGVIFYRQERIGLKGKPFIMYKLVTMIPDAEKDGPRLWVEGDPRQTKWGAIIRKRRFDELPQLFNILKGDMSLVGPTRPERKYYIDQLEKIAPQYMKLLNVKPGLVSIGIVEYGYASSIDEMKERMQYDMLYIKDSSPFRDVHILIKAFWKVILGKGK